MQSHCCYYYTTSCPFLILFSRSVAKSCPIPCDPMDCSMPGLPVPHHLLNFSQVHIHGIGDAIQPSITWCSLFLLPSNFPSIRDFSNELAVHIRCSITGASALVSVLPMSIQGWFPLRLIGLISLLSKGLSGVFSSTTVWRDQFFGVLPSLQSRSHNLTWPLGRP